MQLWLTVSSGIPHLCKQERKRPTLLKRRLSRTPTVLGKAIPGGWVPMSGMEVRSLVVLSLSNHSALHRWSAQSTTLMLLLLSDELTSCCVAGTNGNGCLDLRRRVFPLNGQVSAEWSRCPGSMARRARDRVAPLRRSSAGWMPAEIWRLSGGVGRRYPVTIRKASLMARWGGCGHQRWAWRGSGLNILQDTCDFFGSGLDLDIYFWKKLDKDSIRIFVEFL